MPIKNFASLATPLSTLNSLMITEVMDLFLRLITHYYSGSPYYGEKSSTVTIPPCDRYQHNAHAHVHSFNFKTERTYLLTACILSQPHADLFSHMHHPP